MHLETDREHLLRHIRRGPGWRLPVLCFLLSSSSILQQRALTVLREKLELPFSNGLSANNSPLQGRVEHQAIYALILSAHELCTLK